MIAFKRASDRASADLIVAASLGRRTPIPLGTP